MHEFDGLAVVDYACSAPYCKIDMCADQLRSYSHRGICRIEQNNMKIENEK